MLIRPAVSADEEAIRAVVRSAYESYVPRMGREPAPMVADYAALIRRGVVSVLTVDRRVEGVIVMWAESDHFHVENVAVRPRRHGEGLGTALLAEAERAARAARQDEIRLYTNEAMTENLAYYPRRGFVETHRLVEDGYRRVYFSRAVDPADAEL